MFDNPQGSDLETEEAPAVVDDSTGESDPQSLFYGDEEAEAAPADSSVNDSVDTDVEADDVETKTFTFKADGEEHTVSEEKIREYASKGIRFYNAMEELASERKAFESQKQEQETKVTEAIEKLEAFIGAQPELDIDELGAEAYMKEKEKREAAQKALDEAKGARQAELQQKTQEHINNELTLLSERMGASWNDAEVMNADVQAAREWMMANFGATKEELSNAINHKFWHMGIVGAKLQKELDQLKSKKESAIKKEVKKAPHQLKPSGTGNQSPKSAADIFYG